MSLLRKMHIKLEQSYSPCTGFSDDIADCDEFVAVSTPCEDMWKKFDDFILTPPQSPPIKFDLVSDTLEDSDVEWKSDGVGLLSDDIFDGGLIFNDQYVDVRHDCMWSGLCNDDVKNSNKMQMSINSNISFNNNQQQLHSSNISSNTSSVNVINPMLSTSPLTVINCSWGEILSSCNDMEVNMSEDEAYGSSSQSSNATSAASQDSLVNDHSYGSPSNSPKPSYKTKHMRSLIYRDPIKKSLPKSLIKGSKCIQKKRPSPVKPTIKFVPSSPAPSISSPKGEILSPSPCKLSKSRKLTDLTPPKTIKCRRISFDKEESSESDEDESTVSKNSLTNKSSKTVYPERRREHNDSERKRRDHLRDSFHYLRDQVPKLKEGQKKPARITILQEATEYINQLIENNRMLEKTKEAESRKRDLLLKRLSTKTR